MAKQKVTKKQVDAAIKVLTRYVGQAEHEVDVVRVKAEQLILAGKAGEGDNLLEFFESMSALDRSMAEHPALMFDFECNLADKMDGIANALEDVKHCIDRSKKKTQKG